MKTVRLVALLTVTILAFVGARPASATAIVITGDTQFTMNWLYTGTDPDLSATALFTISGWTGTSFDLTVSNIANTMPLSPDIDARLVSFGVGFTPDATSTDNIVNGDDFSWGFSNFPEFQTVDICAYAGTDCAGGGNAGLGQGQSSDDVLSITIFGQFQNGLTISPLAARFQTRDGSFTFDEGGVCIDCQPFEPLVTPEPTSLLLLGTGLAVVARRLRKR